MSIINVRGSTLLVGLVMQNDLFSFSFPDHVVVVYKVYCPQCHAVANTERLMIRLLFCQNVFNVSIMITFFCFVF